jgi:hypothetical protein
MAIAMVPGASVYENVRSVLQAGWTNLVGDPVWASIQMEFWVHATREEWAQRAMSKSFRECQGYLTKALAAGQHAGQLSASFDPQLAARLILGLSDGILVQWQVQPKRANPLKMIEPMTEMIVGYLTTESST